MAGVRVPLDAHRYTTRKKSMNTTGWVECTPAENSLYPKETSFNFKSKPSDKKRIYKIKKERSGYHGPILEFRMGSVWKSLVNEVLLPPEGSLRLLLSEKI